MLGSCVLVSLEIENLRGIAQGRLDALARLVAFVGPNGSGKSTLLEGAFIGAAPAAGAAVGEIVERRTETRGGARWVIRGGQSTVAARIAMKWSDGELSTRRLSWTPALHVPSLAESLARAGAPGPYSGIYVDRDFPEAQRKYAPRRTTIGFAANNDHVVEEGTADATPRAVRFVDPRRGDALHDAFSRAVQEGRRAEVTASAKLVVPNLESVEILTESGEPQLFLTYAGGAVPASLAGDGVLSLLRVSFELANAPNTVRLIEEPEVHQYPRSMHATATAIVAAVRRGTQVLLTTHSLELIDMLLAQLSAGERDDASFFQIRRVALRDGVLQCVTIPAAEGASARTTLAEDLR